MNRRNFIKIILELAILQVGAIVVGPAKNFKNNLIDKTTKNSFIQGLPTGNSSVLGWELSNNKYIHHCYIKENNKFTYYIDGLQITLTNKRTILIW